MSDSRRWLQEKIARLDGTHARRTIALGAMAAFLVLALGPKTIRTIEAVGEWSETLFRKAPAPVRKPAPAVSPASSPSVAKAPSPSGETPSADLAVSKAAALDPKSPSAPAVAPKLALLLPKPDAAQPAPVSLSARITEAAAASVIFEIHDQDGSIRNLQATPANDGAWSALFDGEPGLYVLSVRASLENGFVQDFPERFGFRILPPSAPPAPILSDASEASATSTVELLSPADQSSFDGSTPVYARVIGDAPERLVFVVDGDDGSETVVLGVTAASGVYWAGFFEGPDGAYQVRARADVGGAEVFSEPRRFVLKRP